MTTKIEQSWEYASWEGRRRAMIRQTLKLSARERLLVLEELCQTSRMLASAKKRR